MSTKPFYSPAQLEQGIKLGHILKSLNRPQQHEFLAAIKGQLEILKDNTPNDVTRQALQLANLSISMAYHALDDNLNACRDGMDKIDGATQALAEQLFPAVIKGQEIDLPLPCFSPNWLEAA